jgi:ArsR family transcriptional regulator, arsenate/arsenite/antimonite-responsive transcriptional repressor
MSAEVSPAGAAALPGGCRDDRPLGEPVVAPDDVALARLAKALGHPARVRILRLLAERDACIARDVVAELPLAQSTVSVHLRILREAGLVQTSSEGPRSVYCVSPAGLERLKAGIAGL